MSTGSFVNEGLCRGLQGVLAREEEKARQRLAVRVKQDEKICLARKEQVVLLQEVRALEGRTMYRQEGPGAEEQRWDCKRVAKNYFLASRNGGEPFKIQRNPNEIVRTPEERLIGIYDEKVVVAERALQAGVVRATKILEAAAKTAQKELELVSKKIENLRKFRSRAYDTLSRRGLILDG